jgi:phosphate transport system substrate-binding protein
MDGMRAGEGGRMRRPKRGVLGAAGATVLALVAAACGGGTGGGGGSQQDLSGEIFISGSSTVEPISALVAELFIEENPGVSITVEGPGTSDGFELFCNGETDVSDASRPIDPEEVQACEENGIAFTELEVALDGISVLTSPNNTGVTCLNTADLYALLGPESEGFASWSDATSLGEEVGGIGTPYPAAPLEITGPGEESGTYDALIELAGFEDLGVERGLSEDDAAVTRPDYVSSPDDGFIINEVAGADSSLGWVGYSFYANNQDVVKAIEISADDESGCVAPTFDTIADGSYPLSRSLFIYVSNEKLQQSEALSSFVDFYMSDTGLQTAVTETEYVPLPADRIEATRQTWEQASAA